ncbi:MAG: hypothetical protein AB8B78_11745 [Polaribacter sp.]
MLFYILYFLSAYLILKEVKKSTHRKKMIFAYVAIAFIGIMYNFGGFVGKQLYLMGFSV